MKNITILFAATLAGALSFLPAQSQEAAHAAQLLERAVQTEQSAGDSATAMQLYREIIATHMAGDRYAAEAAYRLALGQIKEGNHQEALALLQQIALRYPEQTEWAQKAAAEIRQLQPAVAGPRVVKFEPLQLATGVSPDLKEITVTFDQPMKTDRWSWTGGGETFPKITGKISYDPSGRTCRLPVQLEPGKVYWIGINSPSHRNFQSITGQAAPRDVLLFATQDAQGNPTPLPPEMLARAKEISGRLESKAPGEGNSRGSADPVEGWRLLDEHKFAEALPVFERAAALHPKDPNAWNGLGWALFHLGQPTKARETFENCLQIEPAHAGALNGLGWLFKNQGNLDQAIAMWEKAVKALPQATAALSGLAGTYLEMGKPAEAAKWYQQWLKAEPGNPQAKEGLAKAEAAKKP